MSVELSNTESLPGYDRAQSNEEPAVKAQEVQASELGTVDKVREAISQQQAENEQRRELSQKEMQKTAEAFVNVAQTLSRELQFTVNQDIEETVVTVIDRHTGETVRQIPSEEIVKLAQRMSELGSNEQQLNSATGLLLNSQA